MTRLMKIDQSGPPRYFGPKLPAFSRYEHSVEVWALLKRFGAPKKEQIIGLLHDAPHTVFSHAGDYIFAKNMNDYVQNSYHDREKSKFLLLDKVHAALRAVGMNEKDYNITSLNYPCLEQSVPDICAERIQYNLHTAVMLNRISRQEALMIVSDLQYKNKIWFFTTKEIARKFAEIPLYFTQNFWGAKWNTEMNIHLAKAIRRALELNLISAKDLYSTDEEIMDKLESSKDKKLVSYLHQCKNPSKKIQRTDYTKEYFKPKFRGVDPLVLSETGELVRLTDLDLMYKNHFEAVKKWCNDGYFLELLA
jgi:HD superfamily phosphohydrolase